MRSQFLDYWLTKGNVFIAHLYNGDRSNKHYYYHKGWKVQALIAYICGVAVPFPGMLHPLNPLPLLLTLNTGFIGPLRAKVSRAAINIGHLGWLLSFIISFFIYYIICCLWPTRNQRIVKEMGLGWEQTATATETIEAIEAINSEPVREVNIKETKM